MTLVPSAKIIGSDTELIQEGYSYILRTKGALVLILGKLHVFRYPVREKN
jgi:hypothetical protein